MSYGAWVLDVLVGFPVLAAVAVLYGRATRRASGYIPVLLLTFLCPPVLVTFSYGNEVALALTCFVGALCMAPPAGRLANFGGGILLSVFGVRLQEFMTGERK